MSVLTWLLVGFVVLHIVSFLWAFLGMFNIWRNFRKRVERGRKGYIYAFTDLGQLLPVVKIGRASDADQRLSSHRTAAPFGLIVYCIAEVADDVYAENFLHRRHASWRISSRNEWFWMTPVMFWELILIRILFKG